MQYPTALVLLVVLWWLRYQRSLRDRAAMFLARGLVCSHEVARDGATRFAPRLADRLRAKRRGPGGTKWHADETSVRVHGAWWYFYRAIDREGNLVEALLRKQRAMAAARRCFVRARDTAGQVPAPVTTAGHSAYPRASRETPGDGVFHRTSRHNNKRIAQDHRGSKQRSYPMRGFGACAAAARCCAGFAEQRQYCRPQVRSDERVALAARRRRFQERSAAVMAALAAA